MVDVEEEVINRKDKIIITEDFEGNRHRKDKIIITEDFEGKLPILSLQKQKGRGIRGRKQKSNGRYSYN